MSKLSSTNYPNASMGLVCKRLAPHNETDQDYVLARHTAANFVFTLLFFQLCQRH